MVDHDADRTEIMERVPEEPVLEAGAATLGRDENNRPNEDTYVLDLPHRFFGVFDGIGGAAGGTIASNQTARTMQALFQTRFESPPTSQLETKMTMTNLFHATNNHLRAIAKGSPDLAGMGTTASVLHIMPGGKQAVVGHAGDSRIYRYQEGTPLQQITCDHDVLYFDEAQGHLPSHVVERIRQKLAAFNQRILDEASLARLYQRAVADRTLIKQSDELLARVYFAQRHVLMQSIGSEVLIPTVQIIPIKSGDTLLLVSDGIHDNLRSAEIVTAMTKCKSPKLQAQMLLQAALFRSWDSSHPLAKPDDMTAVVVRVK